MQLKYGKLTYQQRYMLMVYAALTGILGALAAYIFEGVIAFVHNLSFSQTVSFYYDHTTHTPASPLGALIIIVPVIGSLIVTWILANYAHQEKGLSVSTVMHAIHYKGGVINPKVSAAKIVASSITIGTGGSVGREGPFIQIGAALSSLISDIADLPTTSRCILIGCGAAAIVTATFNAPIAGIAFAIEALVLSLGFTTISCLAIATITATLFKYLLSGAYPIFLLKYSAYLQPPIPLTTEIFIFSLIGIGLGIFSWLFIICLYTCQDISAAVIKNQYVRHATGMFFVGLLFYLLFRYSGHYYIEGIGFALIQDTLSNIIHNPWLLLTIMLLKFTATCLTLGSGASGGIFSPVLFIGGLFGALASIVMAAYFPDANIGPTILVLAGMAGMLAATSGALITAVLLVIEVAWYYHAALPIIIAATVALLTRRLLCRDSIYTMKYTRMGISLPQWP